MDFFTDFSDDRVDVGDVELRVRHAGDGPAVLLLHGHPRTGATWHRVAPRLVDAGYTVVCPDLRGYGASGTPPTDADHRPYSKRAMAGDVVALARALGLDRFHLAGHDRGTYVALRTALDHPDVVATLTVMDGVPISEALDRCGARFAQAWWHWFFFAQPEIPERVILADPDAWYRIGPARNGNEREWHAAVRDPATVVAMLEDYRAGLGVDRRDEDADRTAGRRVRCPLQMLWSRHDDMEFLYGDPLRIWRSWADDVTGGRIDSGHHMAEQAPEQLVDALVAFLRDAA